MVAAGLIDSSIGWPATIAGIPVEEIPIRMQRLSAGAF
jgi:hypothetical protein